MATQTKTREKARSRDRADILSERRKLRSDLGAYKSVMSVPEGAEYDHLFFRWVNDRDGSGRRIEYLKRLGWRIWEGPSPLLVGDANIGSENNVSLGTGGEVIASKSEGFKAILMYIEKELWETDQEIKDQRLQESEASIYDKAAKQGLVRRPV